MAADLWFRRVHQKPILPLLALLTVVLTFGWLNSEVLSPYARPRLFGDDRGGVAIYDLALFDEQNAAFIFREKLGKRWTSPRKASGRVLDGALSDEELILLYPKFISLHNRDTRKRVGAIDISKLGLKTASLASQVHGEKTQLTVFGIDDEQTLRVANVSGGSVELGKSKVVEATGLLAQDIQQPDSRFNFFSQHSHVEEFRPIRNKIKVSLATATLGSQSLVLVGTPKAAYEAAQKRREVVDKAIQEKKPIPPAEPVQQAVTGFKMGEKRSHFTLYAYDHGTKAFSEAIQFPEPVLTATIVEAKKGFELFVVKDQKANDIEHWSIDTNAKEASKKLTRVGVVPFERGGLFNTHGASEIAAARVQGETLLLGQFGGSIRLLNLSDPVVAGKKPQWFVLAELPNEAQTIIFGWFVVVMTLVSLLVLFGLQNLRQRRVGWPPMSVTSLDDEIRTIVELGHREAQRRNSKATVGRSAETAVESKSGESGRESSRDSNRENKVDAKPDSPRARQND